MDKPTVQLSPAPPALTEPYQKARRSYVLASGLLIAWELIGFDVSEVPLENINITIKSPQAIPAVLIVLIFYFALRLLQEWFQCDPGRRKHRWALSDFHGAHLIAALAFVVYGTQRLLEVRLAELVAAQGLIVFALWFVVGAALAHTFWRWKWLPLWMKCMYAMMLVLTLAVSYRTGTKAGMPILLYVLGCTIGSALSIVIFSFYFQLLFDQRRGVKAVSAERSE